MLGIKSILEIMMTCEYHCMQPYILNSLFAVEPSILEMAYQATYGVHHDSVLSRILRQLYLSLS